MRKIARPLNNVNLSHRELVYTLTWRSLVDMVHEGIKSKPKEYKHMVIYIRCL